MLNLQTTLTRAVTPVTPGVKLPKAKIIKTERTPTGEHLRLKSCRQAKTPYDRPSPSPAKSAARGIDKSSNLPFRGTFYTIGSSISVILITQMDFLIINSVQNLRGGDFLYLCIVRTARWTFGHWDEDATHILRGTARPLVGRCFSWLSPDVNRRTCILDRTAQKRHSRPASDQTTRNSPAPGKTGYG